MASEDYGYVDQDYLVKAAELVWPVKEESYRLMHIQPGYSVLDVGSGPGIDTLGLAKLVGEAGRVVGVDHDPNMVAEADQRAAEAGVAGWVAHHDGDATSLMFDDNTFDAVRSERVLQHLTDPEQAIREMIRVVKPQGWVVVVDTDHSSMSIDTKHIRLEWALRQSRTEAFANGFSGRRLYGQFRRNGLTNLQVRAMPFVVHDYRLGRFIAQVDRAEDYAVRAGYVNSHDDFKSIHAELEKADAEGAFFGYGMMLVVAGQKP